MVTLSSIVPDLKVLVQDLGGFIWLVDLEGNEELMAYRWKYEIYEERMLKVIEDDEERGFMRAVEI